MSERELNLDEPAIQAIAQLARDGVEGRAEIVKSDNGTEFLKSEGQLTDLRTLYQPIAIAPLRVASLVGLADYVTANVERHELADCMLVVRSHAHVELVNSVGGESEKYARDVYAQAMLEDVQPFKFDTFLPQDDFIIGLLTRFEHTEQLLALVAAVGHIVAEETIGASDNGVSQTVTVQKGSGLKEVAEVQAIWRLRPFRTFREIPQPESPFLLRMARSAGQPPTLKLMEADGGLWRVHARAGIKAFLEAALAVKSESGAGTAKSTADLAASGTGTIVAVLA